MGKWSRRGKGPVKNDFAILGRRKIGMPSKPDRSSGADHANGAPRNIDAKVFKPNSDPAKKPHGGKAGPEQAEA